jgi:hypothetical protein
MEQHVKRVQRQQIEREMQEYVEAMAPHSGEFVKETEPHVVQQLLEQTEWRGGRATS